MLKSDYDHITQDIIGAIHKGKRPNPGGKNQNYMYKFPNLLHLWVTLFASAFVSKFIMFLSLRKNLPI
jgi:hypothetical protein